MGYSVFPSAFSNFQTAKQIKIDQYKADLRLDFSILRSMHNLWRRKITFEMGYSAFPSIFRFFPFLSHYSVDDLLRAKNKMRLQTDFNKQISHFSGGFGHFVDQNMLDAS